MKIIAGRPVEQKKNRKLRGYCVAAKSAKEGEIWVYEEIGEGFFGGISAKQFAKDVKALGSVAKITVRLHSPGGDVFDAVTMYNILKQHKAEVLMNIDGEALSAASMLAMAGDEILMAKNAIMMIHDAWTIAIGPAEKMRRTAEMLEKVNATIVRTYADRVTIDEAEIIQMMSDESWIDAEQAVAMGFADGITEELAVAAYFDTTKFKYKNAPKRIEAEALVPPANDIRTKLARMQMASQRANRAAGTPAPRH